MRREVRIDREARIAAGTFVPGKSLKQRLEDAKMRRERVVKMNDAGKSVDEIAEAMSSTKRTVYNLMQSAGVRPKSSKGRPVKTPQIPPWVPEQLVSEWIDRAMQWNEFAACSWARRENLNLEYQDDKR
jgi:transposase